MDRRSELGAIQNSLKLIIQNLQNEIDLKSKGPKALLLFR